MNADAPRNSGRELVTRDYLDRQLDRRLAHLATKADLEPLATKAELEPLATKAELEQLATKAELEQLATKADLEHLATKAELEQLATKAELEHLALAMKVDLEALRADMHRLLGETESRLLRWTVGAMAALSAIVSAIVRLAS